MKKLILLLVIVLSSSGLKILAQEETNTFGIKFSGFVKSDFFFDSRQGVSAREGHFYLWPAAESLDANGEDINAKSNFNFLAVQSRLTGSISGPDAFGAKTSGLIEGDFFAQANDNINLFRLRHAFVKLKWTNTELLAGQYWNPLFVTGCFPGTVSFNTGTPLQSFARNPQIRLTQSFGDLQLIVAALAQRDYTSRGPDPANNNNTLVSSDFLRNSSVPDFHLQVHYKLNNEEAGNSVLFGAGAAYKVLAPRLSSKSGPDIYKVKEKVSGLTAIAFTNITTRPATIKLQGRYGENIADVLSISGFAVKEEVDAATGERSYTPLKNISFWGEVHTNGTKVQAGIFGGFLKNQGTKEEMSAANNPVYGLATNIESLIRVSPRVIFISGKTKIACELEYTSAAYGNNYDTFYVPATTKSVANMRMLLSAIYAF
jgi:hypothetical protein